MGSTYKLVSESDEWLKILNIANNASGYVLREEFEVVAVSGPEVTPTIEPTAEPTAALMPITNFYAEPAFGTVLDNGVIMYKDTVEDPSGIMGVLNYGNSLTLLGDNEYWYDCVFNYKGRDYRGYVLKDKVGNAPAPTPEPTPEPTVGLTPEPYDEKWVENREAVALFQDQLIRLGWLNEKDIETYGELDAPTYDVIAEIQRTFLEDGTYIPVYNEDGTVNPIDEVTYNCIMNELKKR